MIVGELIIQMRADLARLSSDMASAKKTVDSAMSGITGSVKAATKILEGLGIAAGADMFVDLIAGAIEAQAHLDDLSKSTGIAVEQLAGLKLAAKVSGTDLDATANTINRLSANMGKNAEAFKALGISVKDPLQAFEQLADIFSQIQDPELRAAVAAQALGKGWQTVAPLLAEGGAHMRDLVDEGTRLSNVTTESAKAANELNKHWQELVGSGGLLNSVVNKLVPGLDALVLSATKFRDAGFGKEVTMAAGGAAMLLSPITQLQAAYALFANHGHEAAQAAKDFAIWANAGDQASRSMASSAAAAGRAFLAAQKNAADAAKLEAFYQQTMAQARTALAIANAEAANGSMQLTQAERTLLAIEQNPLWAKLPKQDQDRVKGILATAAAKQQEAQITEAQVKAEEALAAIDAKTMQEVQELLKRGKDRLDNANALVESYKQEIATLGLSDAAREQVILGLQREAALRDVLNPDTRKGIQNAYDEAKALASQKAALQDQLAVWGQLGDKVGQFFSDLVQHGHDAFGDLRNMIKQFFGDMVALFAKRWILQLGAAATGSSGLANAAISTGANSLEGSVGSALLSGAGSDLFGVGAGAGTASLFGTGALTGAGDFVGTGIAGFAGNVALAAGATDAFAAEVAAAVPVIGWIVAIGLVLYSIFGNKGGAPKAGGSFMGGFDASGAFTGSTAVPGSDNGRFYTPNNSDADLQQSVMATSAAYQATVARFRGTAQGFRFGVGYDADTGGGAGNRVSGILQDSSGNVDFSEINRAIGNDNTTIGPELQLTLSRELLVALQKTLTGPVDAIIKSLDAAGATQDQINAVLALADAFQTLKDSLGPISTQDIIKQASEDSVSALTDQAKALMTLADNTSMTTDGLNNLTQAVGQFKGEAAQLIVQIEQAKISIHDLFAGTARSITLSGLDTQGQYDFYRSEAATLQQQALASSDPALVQALGQRIDQDIEAAWNLLTADQQAAARPQFLQDLSSTDSLIAQHFTAIQSSVESMVNTMLGPIGDKLDTMANAMTTAASGQQDAAAGQQAAAATQQAAANTPTVVILQYPDGTQSTSFSGA